MGGHIAKETTSNGNLRSRSIVTKDTIDPKGWPHPEGRQGRRNTVEASPTNQVQRRGTQAEGAGPTREKAGQPSGPTQAEAHSVSLRQVPRTKAKSKPTQKEGKQRHNRGLRKNTDPTWDRWPNVKTRITTGSRNPEAQQRHEGKPTSTWQITRVTTSTAKLRRVDNQGTTLTTQSHQQTLEARGKNPRKDFKKIPGAWTTKRQEPRSENKDKGRRVPLKEGRNLGRIAAYKAKS